MNIELIGIIILLLMFIIGAILPINIGLLGFVAAFFLGSVVSGLDVDEIFAGYPGDLFVLLAGVTFFFAIVQNNGTIDLITNWGLKLVRGKIALIPWVMFVLIALLASIGTQATACVMIVAPIAMRLAAQYNINPVMMGSMIVIASTAASFSPLNLFGLIVKGVMESSGIPHEPLLLFLNTMLFTIVVAAIMFVSMGGLRIGKSPNLSAPYIAATAEDGVEQKETGLNWYRAMTLIGIVVLIFLALVLEINMGFAALIVGFALTLMAPKDNEKVFKSLPWPVIFMITGIVTYVGVLDTIGALDYLTDLIASIGSSTLAALSASYVGGIISAFASTTGFLAAIIPLATPILEDPNISSIGVVAAIAISSSIVDLSPFSTSGALIVANAQGMDVRVFYRKLLIVAGLIIAFGPGLAWLVFVLIGVPWG
ncbi:SLC13 family permease [Caldibacillus lycopersici]|uniref:SLC13 family permease n=1 Tax=Perspicuibacillus lycopersici TaxID=1325689 RepID=A0AAE3IS69_9BACI|nr:SLC13 family permease [Perspicuibacillus lycopersici]MCU9613501.1 SLC13 family permease [Perspicuibacillus lycopersici]